MIIIMFDVCVYVSIVINLFHSWILFQLTSSESKRKKLSMGYIFN